MLEGVTVLSEEVGKMALVHAGIVPVVDGIVEDPVAVVGVEDVDGTVKKVRVIPVIRLVPDFGYVGVLANPLQKAVEMVMVDFIVALSRIEEKVGVDKVVTVPVLALVIFVEVVRLGVPLRVRLRF